MLLSLCGQLLVNGIHEGLSLLVVGGHHDLLDHVGLVGVAHQKQVSAKLAQDGGHGLGLRHGRILHAVLVGGDVAADLVGQLRRLLGQPLDPAVFGGAGQPLLGGLLGVPLCRQALALDLPRRARLGGLQGRQGVLGTVNQLTVQAALLEGSANADGTAVVDGGGACGHDTARQTADDTRVGHVLQGELRVLVDVVESQEGGIHGLGDGLLGKLSRESLCGLGQHGLEHGLPARLGRALGHVETRLFEDRGADALDGIHARAQLALQRSLDGTHGRAVADLLESYLAGLLGGRGDALLHDAGVHHGRSRVGDGGDQTVAHGLADTARDIAYEARDLAGVVFLVQPFPHGIHG